MVAILDFKMDITYTGSYISPMDVLTRVMYVYLQKHMSLCCLEAEKLNIL